MSVNRRMNGEQSVTYTYKGMLFCLKKDVLTRATIRMNLEDVIPSEMSRPQKTSCMIPLACGSQRVTPRGGKQSGGCRRGRGRPGRECFLGSVSVWKEEKVREVNSGDGTTET